MKDEKFPRAYACYNKNLEIRLKSTSGGIFTLIAEHVIQTLGGVVFGAAFDEQFAVRHVMVDDIAGLERLRGSKYPQSDVGLCYREVRERLENGTAVLFTGAPCQVAGLHRYLGRDYDNLLCMDFICHGVASPGVWRGYLTECRDLPRIRKIVFKDKATGWKNWQMKIQYDSHALYRPRRVEPFMRSYLRYANIRPSCYRCHFKGIAHESDFTISDCWGIGEKNARLNDDKGLSALLIQNERAERIFELLRENIECEEYDPDELMGGNWTTYRSVPEHRQRQEFFDAYKARGTKYAFQKYFNPSLKDWLWFYRQKLRKGRKGSRR